MNLFVVSCFLEDTEGPVIPVYMWFFDGPPGSRAPLNSVFATDDRLMPMGDARHLERVSVTLDTRTLASQNLLVYVISKRTSTIIKCEY